MLMRIFLFVITNILIVVTVSVITSLLGVQGYLSADGLDYGALAVFCLIWGFVGAFISLAISRLVAKWILGVKVLDPRGSHEYQWLVNLVHRLSQQAGLPAMPQVGVYSSPQANAFATGPSKSRSLVAFSTGILDSMPRQAIEGVAAHEIAHIRNGDMVTMTLLQGLINAFVIFFARVFAHIASRAVDEKYSRLVWYVVLITAEILFGILGMLVTFWFSRQREFRADQGGAKLAGRETMRSALEQLRRLQENRHTAAMPASLAALAIEGKSSRLWFSTHPSLEERIKRLG